MSGEVKFQGDVGGQGYFMVMNEQGAMHCSCGRELVRVDKDTFKCSGGYPIYRPEKGEVEYDKFGNIMIKIKEHKKEQ